MTLGTSEQRTASTSVTRNVGSTPAVRSRTQNMVTAALIAAIMAALGPVAVTAGTVPITLQVFPVALAAMLLPAEWAAGAMGVYLVLGAIGIPVYAHGTAGMGVLLGPTGGYIVGFVVGAALGAWGRGLVARRTPLAIADMVAAVLTVAGVYAMGWWWLVFGPAHAAPGSALMAYVLPFVIPDLVKASVAVLVAGAVRRAVSG
jgi:biotin transport system substrate-specific component